MFKTQLSIPLGLNNVSYFYYNSLETFTSRLQKWYPSAHFDDNSIPHYSNIPRIPNVLKLLFSLLYINWNTSSQDGDSSLLLGTSRKQYWCSRNAVFAWHQTFGGKLDVSSASKITKTASINWRLLTSVTVFLEFAVIMNTDSIDPLRTTPAAFPQVIQSCLSGRNCELS